MGFFLFLFWREILASSLARAVVAARLPDIWKSWTQGQFPSTDQHRTVDSDHTGVTAPHPHSPSCIPSCFPCSVPYHEGKSRRCSRHGEVRLCLKASSSPFQTGSVRQIKGYFSVQTLPRADSLCRFVVGFAVYQLIPFSYSLRILAVAWEKALCNSQVIFLIEIFRVWACSIQIGALNERWFVCSLLCVFY